MNTRNYLIGTLLFLLVLVGGCDNPVSNKPIHQSSNGIQSNFRPSSASSQSAPVEDYISYPDNGRYFKYFDKNWNVVHYKSKASFYRSAYYRNGVIDPDSLAVDYFITGEKQGEAHLFAESPDKCNGKMLIYYKNGQIAAESYYKNGLHDGKSTRFYENGNKEYVLHFKNGLREGEHIYYHENGKVDSKVTFKNDKPHGTCYFYYENGTLKEVGSFNNGISTGTYKSYYADGKIQSKGNYKNGKKSGVWYFYDEYGHYTTRDYDHPVIVQQSQPNNYRSRRNSFTPNDAYDEGYDNGYEQGYEDGRRGRSFEYGYDDSSSYYDYYEEKYEEGYRDGYEEGYYAGQMEYDEDEDEDDWW